MSKGLDSFKRILCNYVYVFKARENGKTQLVHDFNTVEKELKALEIIKEKKVDIKMFMLDSCLEHYNMNYRCEDLTQEEYDLLKEVLKICI